MRDEWEEERNFSSDTEALCEENTNTKKQHVWNPDE